MLKTRSVPNYIEGALQTSIFNENIRLSMLYALNILRLYWMTP